MWLESFLTRPPTFHTQVRIVLSSCSLQIFLRLVLTLVPLRRLILSFFNMFSSYFLPYDFLLPPAFDICLHLPLITALPHVDFPHKSPPPPHPGVQRKGLLSLLLPESHQCETRSLRQSVWGGQKEALALQHRCYRVEMTVNLASIDEAPGRLDCSKNG